MTIVLKHFAFSYFAQCLYAEDLCEMNTTARKVKEKFQRKNRLSQVTARI